MLQNSKNNQPFTTAEIKIDMNNIATINSDMDIDGVVEKLTERVEEELLATAEGVHLVRRELFMAKKDSFFLGSFTASCST